MTVIYMYSRRAYGVDLTANLEEEITRNIRFYARVWDMQLRKQHGFQMNEN